MSLILSADLRMHNEHSIIDSCIGQVWTATTSDDIYGWISLKDNYGLLLHQLTNMDGFSRQILIMTPSDDQ